MKRMGEVLSGKKNENKREKYSAVKVVTNYIEELVLNKQIKPGDRMPTEHELSATLNIGRGSVREAIKILETNGLVNIKRGDGTFLSHPEDIVLSVPLLYRIILSDSPHQELLEFRRELELSIMRMAILNASDDDIEKIQLVHRKLESYIGENNTDIDYLIEIDGDFHRHIAKAAKNRYYEQLYLFTLELFMPLVKKNYISGQKPEETYELHSLLLSAIMERDVSKIEGSVNDSIEVWDKWMLLKE